MSKPATQAPILAVQGLTKTYPDAGGGQITVLSSIDLTLHPGQSAAIVGPSGCGKTTLLNVIGTLDTPTAGTVSIAGNDITALNEKQRAETRAKQIGFVFQEHHLLPQCNALENALIPTLAKGVDRKSGEQRAADLLERVGLGDRLHHRPDALSGGQRQRVAIVRALINRPALLLVDEPTGALDSKTAGQIMDLLIELNQAEQTAMLMVTHADALAARLDRTLRLEQGQITAGADA
ncbi:MAG: ABC transporter ATP-binding protein [Phycisphaeraceae bacterium]|nr:ABC transporter ATP-binding protein [Phycisphaeraceae bacterium]